jgi:uncharacterized protein YbjT (DUF2867 family)
MLVNHGLDLGAASLLPVGLHIDDAVIALGTTIKVAGSQAAFRSIDFDAVLAVAKAAQAAGASRLGVVSAMGANARSGIFYNRVKGEMEAALRQLGYPTLIIARPSMLAGDRASLAQPPRPAEKWVSLVMALLNPVLPANYQAIGAGRVAHALLSAMQDTTPQTRVLLSGQMQHI